MNHRESFFSILVIAGLLLTAILFSRQSSFDCYQPMFSDQSSCSLSGGSCIKIHVQAGALGLWKEFKGLLIKKTETGIRIECAPNCYVDIDSESPVNPDTANKHLQ